MFTASSKELDEVDLPMEVVNGASPHEQTI